LGVSVVLLVGRPGFIHDLCAFQLDKIVIDPNELAGVEVVHAIDQDVFVEQGFEALAFYFGDLLHKSPFQVAILLEVQLHSALYIYYNPLRAMLLRSHRLGESPRS
jgi:hypothetical protein